MFFKIPEVEAKYFNKMDKANPDIRVVIPYSGKLSDIPMDIADHIFKGGGHIGLKADKKAAAKEEAVKTNIASEKDSDKNKG